jgi:phage tail sheath protein FI
MSGQFLHGIEVIELTTGTRPIQTVRSSVIGLVGTAPGADADAFPLNTPVLIAGNQREAAALGNQGSLPAAIDDIFDQAGAMVVVVRVASDNDAADELANVIGGVNAAGHYEGVKALLSAQSVLGITPRILISPGYSQNAALVTEMVSIATKLRAIIVADGPNTTDAAAIAYRNLFGSDRVYLVDPWVKVFDTALAAEVIRPVSARVAGVIAKSDAERGYWHSPSNRLIEGITGLARPVEFAIGDATSRANYLNENEVTTIIQHEGFRLWGNRSCASDPKMAFLKRRRIANMISKSIQAAHMWAMDRNIDRNYLEDVTEGVNAYGRSLIARGALVGFKCWAPADLNTPLELEAGKVTFDFDWSDPATAEHITFRSVINNGYLAEVLPAAA